MKTKKEEGKKMRFNKGFQAFAMDQVNYSNILFIKLKAPQIINK